MYPLLVSLFQIHSLLFFFNCCYVHIHVYTANYLSMHVLRKLWGEWVLSGCRSGWGSMTPRIWCYYPLPSRGTNPSLVLQVCYPNTERRRQEDTHIHQTHTWNYHRHRSIHTGKEDKINHLKISLYYPCITCTIPERTHEIIKTFI